MQSVLTPRGLALVTAEHVGLASKSQMRALLSR